ncbi:MAG: NYN domain-containing protein [Burkholderiales bacterium]|nr:NYN domain-containing protein [Burkholderiales bacterium]
MNRFVVMVDAGYLLRQSIEIVSHRASTSRADLEISDPAGLIRVLLDKSSATLDLSGKELLRVYWYDGVMANGFTPQQRSLVNVDDVQFRAGTINGRGQQKGVDSLIVTDLIELTSHHAICDAVLVTGDSDLAVGIEVAQKRGVRIAVLGVEDLAAGVAHHQSFEITSRADRVGMLGQTELAQVLRFAPVQQAPVPPAVGVPTGSAPAAAGTAAPPLDRSRIEVAVRAFISQQATPLTGVVDHTTKRIDGTVDRALLHHVFTELGHGRLTEAEKVYARQVFRSAV